MLLSEVHVSLTVTAKRIRLLGLMEHAAAAAAAKVGALKKQVAAPIVALKTAPLGGLPKAVVPPMMRRGKPLQVRQ